MTPAIPTASVPILGGGHFPVRRIYCVGRNYRAHAIEMGSDPDRETPFFFLKPADAIVPDGGTIPYPPRTVALEHEIELVVAIGGEAASVPAEAASPLIFGYAVGLDMTRRDLQAAAKKSGRPWDMAKGFDHSAPCGPITPAGQTGPIASGDIWLKINGSTVQSSNLSQLIWSIPEIIAELSTYMTLKPGDLIYTGTPDKVGPVQRGDRLHGHIDGLADLAVTIA
jgi:fumarylpyruvate hydrolase